MLSKDQKEAIQEIVDDALNRAEQHWADGGHKLITKSASILDSINEAKAESEPSRIPGHPVVSDDVTEIDEFVAFFADLRDSSTHLMCAISPKYAKVSGLQRVFYETSALFLLLLKPLNIRKGW